MSELETQSPAIENENETTETTPQYVKPVIPEGMSKKQWKREQKKLRWAEKKEEYAADRKEKKKRARLAKKAKIAEYVDRGERIPEELKKKPRANPNQKETGINIILDCSFNDLMNDKEIVSMSTQLVRAYSSNKRLDYFANVVVSKFETTLKERFEGKLCGVGHNLWKHFTFQEEEFEATENMVYLTADTDEVLEELTPGMTYVIGGIVDKNRYKNLCLDKAKKMGIPVRKLPIDQYIKMKDRKVLTTAHVVELMLKWFEHKDWREAFEAVIPQRKIVDVVDNSIVVNGVRMDASQAPSTLREREEEENDEDEAVAEALELEE